MLQDEIGESLLRMKAAKFGHPLDQIAPPYSNAYYLPDKKLYEPNVNEKQHKRASTQDFQSAAQAYMKSRVGVRKPTKSSVMQSLPLTSSTKPMTSVDPSRTKTGPGDALSSTFITEGPSVFGKSGQA